MKKVKNLKYYTIIFGLVATNLGTGICLSKNIHEKKELKIKFEKEMKNSYDQLIASFNSEEENIALTENLKEDKDDGKLSIWIHNEENGYYKVYVNDLGTINVKPMNLSNIKVTYITANINNSIREIEYTFNHDSTELIISGMNDLDFLKSGKFESVEKVHLLHSSSRDISDIQILENLEDLSISCYDNLSDISDLTCLKKLKRLWIKGCPNLTNLSGFEYVDNLEISGSAYTK